MSTMSKRPPWFWNTALLERLTWLLLTVVLTAYAGRRWRNGAGRSKTQSDQKNMLTRIICPNCNHVGATGASLPRVLICSQCGHGALIRSGKQARSHITQEEDAEPTGGDDFMDGTRVAGAGLQQAPR
jgi:hypothetical protein